MKLDGKRITAIVTESGKTFAGKMFVDATYEGDLMAAAGVSFTVGREGNAKYGETMDGAAYKWQTHTHRFVVKVDPFVTPGDPKSDLRTLWRAWDSKGDGAFDQVQRALIMVRRGLRPRCRQIRLGCSGIGSAVFLGSDEPLSYGSFLFRVLPKVRVA